ncbi:MAG: hypothetical protein JWN06_3861 [Propionibacteriaceae bacterium]|jgi:hypothetical protein|nr:hypothetical protein [Propionibacteriaceae bacterium]
MTTEGQTPQPAGPIRPTPPGSGPTREAATEAAHPSVHVVRARKLLYGGLVGGVSAALVCLLGFGLAYGSQGVASAAFAAGLVLVFYAVGQFVMVLFADAGARTLMMVSLGSYTMRVVLLGLVLLAYNNNRADWPQFVPVAVFVTTIAVVVGWLAVEVFVFSRLRIGVYDTEYSSPSERGDAE